MASFTLLTALFAASSLALPQATTPEKPTVTIDNGVVIGTMTSIPDSDTTVNQFLGIPFGANPIRFSAPEPAKPWNTPYDASRYQPSCLMQFNYPEAKRNRTIKTFVIPGPPAGTSEDCLNLNIYAPAGSNAGSKPIAFWIHGGSFLHGSGSLPYYDGSKMAGHEDIIVVTINYRTNIFGFPTTYDLPEGKWNVGFLDQRLALQWVQDNIAAFGGDPKKVTIFGESAGAGSVDDLITAPPEPLPFRAAILQSGTANTNVTPNGAWEHATKLARCDKGKFDEVLECMRIVPATELKEIIERAALEFKPISDTGVTLANFPRDVRLQSRKTNNIMARVPVMLGSTADEARLEDFMNITVKQALSAWLPNVTTEQANLLKMYYPIGALGITNEYDQVVRIATELGMQCPIRYTAEDFHSTGINTWRFMYNASFPNTEIFNGSGAYHSSEIPTLFGTYPEERSTEFQGKLSRAMQRAWGQFIRDPQNGPGWDQIPHIGVFGGGVSPEKPGKVFEVFNSTLAEKRCIAFKDIWTKGKSEESLGPEN